MANGKAGKIFSIILKVITWMIVAVTVFMMIFTIVSVNTFDKQNGQGIFGYKFLTVLSDSMSKSGKNADMDVHFSTEDIVIIKQMKDATKDGLEYKKGDIIAFNTEKEGKMVTVTHMIHSVITDEETNKVIGYKTFGTNTGAIDEGMVEPVNVIGKYVGKLPKAALFFADLKTVPGYIVCILIPFLLLIGYNGLNCIMLFRKYKREQMEEMNAEKEKLEAERDEALKMMKELQALKDQMEAAAAKAEAAPTETAPPETISVETAPADNAHAEAEQASEASLDAVVESEGEVADESAEESALEVGAEEAVDEPQDVEENLAENVGEEETPVAEKSSAEDALEAEKQKNLEMAKELEALKAQAALEEERRKTQEMMKELEALKAQLAQTKAENNSGNTENN